MHDLMLEILLNQLLKYMHDDYHLNPAKLYKIHDTYSKAFSNALKITPACSKNLKAKIL